MGSSKVTYWPSFVTQSSETAHRSRPWIMSPVPHKMMPTTLELPFSPPCPQLCAVWPLTWSVITPLYTCQRCCQIKLPDAVYLKTRTGPGTHQVKSISPMVAFPGSLHLAQTSFQCHFMPLARVPPEGAFPEHTPTLCASLITRFPHIWNVLLKHTPPVQTLF